MAERYTHDMESIYCDGEMLPESEVTRRLNAMQGVVDRLNESMERARRESDRTHKRGDLNEYNTLQSVLFALGIAKGDYQP